MSEDIQGNDRVDEPDPKPGMNPSAHDTEGQPETGGPGESSTEPLPGGDPKRAPAQGSEEGAKQRPPSDS